MRHLDQAGRYLREQVGEDLGRAVLGEVPDHLRRRRAYVGQLREVLDLRYRAAQSAHGLGGPLVAKVAVVLLALDLHEGRYILEGADYLSVSQLAS